MNSGSLLLAVQRQVAFIAFVTIDAGYIVQRSSVLYNVRHCYVRTPNCFAMSHTVASRETVNTVSKGKKRYSTLLVLHLFSDEKLPYQALAKLCLFLFS